MPTIEIVSVQAKKLNLKQEDFKFAIIEENKLITHRGLFHDFLFKQKGVMVHIGGVQFINDKDNFFYGSGLLKFLNFPIDESVFNDSDDIIQYHGYKFEEEFKSDFRKLLEIALNESPVEKAYFLTDMQFGNNGSIVEDITIDKLFEMNDNNELVINTLYKIVK
jgi:hypothetical protein